jgi:hypothetical protein
MLVDVKNEKGEGLTDKEMKVGLEKQGIPLIMGSDESTKWSFTSGQFLKYGDVKHVM